MLNQSGRMPLEPREAEIEYLEGDMRVRRPGDFVRCAVTGAAIPVSELRYWNVDLQEAYASPQAKIDRLKQLGQIPRK